MLYLTNFRHKYSFVYLSCLGALEEFEKTKDDLLKWMDLAMFKPQQGAFIGYDEHPLISTRFFEDFIYVNFDNIEDIGHPDIDWITHPDLKLLFKRWEWFEEDDSTQLNIEVLEKPLLEFDTHTKVHYKHFERWRLANTLVALYGKDQGYKYLRLICSNTIKDKELQADCIKGKKKSEELEDGELEFVPIEKDHLTESTEENDSSSENAEENKEKGKEDSDAASETSEE